MAAGLVARVPWLGRGVHIGRVCGLLHRAGVDPARWTVGGLLTAMDAQLRDDGLAALSPDQQRDPRAYFGWLVARTLAADPEPDRARVARERSERVAKAARRRAADQDQAADAVAMTPELRDRLRTIATDARAQAQASREGSSTPR